jgi:hypothetical protein
MGEAKRRKALGFGSAKGKNWKYVKGSSIVFDWVDLGFDRSVDFLLNDLPKLIPNLRIFFFCKSCPFIRQLLDRASESPDWAAKRDRIATLLSSIRSLRFYGRPSRLDEIEFIEKVSGHIHLDGSPETLKEVEEMRGSSSLEGAA